MTHSRIPETDHGIQGEITVTNYDLMQRHLRDKGWIETKALLENGITSGRALEIGHGPGYLGLEWLKNTQNTTLTGLDISPDMHKLVKHNAQLYGLSSRVDYHLGNCDHLPFEDNTFDAVFTNGSLHEWSNPIIAFNEIWRVLKPGSSYFISDLRRDMNFFVRAFLWWGTQPANIRPGLITSINAAYTSCELEAMLQKTSLINGKVVGNLIDVSVFGIK
jgi:ubiquinone/menaquinone biosynthesis C-methylase UbiE